MNRVLIINGELIFPPTETACFRDVTLYSTIFTSAEVLLQVDQHHKDVCYQYLKDHGAFDFIQEIVTPRELVPGTLISNRPPCSIKVRKFWAGNLNRILNSIRSCL